MSGIDIKPDAQGKVRDIYDLGDKLLMVATDRISAFDYILEDEIPHKGAVLTQLSCFWFELLDGVVENHLISADVADLVRRMFAFIRDFEGEIPGAKPEECGNYLDQNLPMANWLARRYLDRDLADIDEKHLHYQQA